MLGFRVVRIGPLHFLDGCCTIARTSSCVCFFVCCSCTCNSVCSLSVVSTSAIDCALEVCSRRRAIQIHVYLYFLDCFVDTGAD